MNTRVMTDKTMQTQPEQHDAMPDPRYENLSALIDGELADDIASQAIKQLVANPDSRTRHNEYLAIGDAMRGLGEQHNDFTRRVMAALENEPVILAPLPKKPERRPVLWLAAATAAAITWGLWQSSPQQETGVPMAAVQPPASQSAEAMPYLAAHQDFAQAVISTQEMRFSKASLEVPQ